MYPHPKISIVVPSLNKVRFIGKTLDSIIAQDYPNLEVIVMDGGSTDGTLKIIEKYAKKFPDIIKYQSGPDKGQLDAINKGFRKAKGKILGYINADDVYEKGAFEEIARLYGLNIDALWFAGRGRVIDGEGSEIAKAVTLYKSLCLTLNFHFLLLIFNFLMQPSVFLTRAAWKKFGPFTGTDKFITEYDLWLKIAKVSMPVTTKKYLSSFRIEPSTITKNFSKAVLKEDERIVKKYSSNPLVILFHNLHNLGRLAIGKAI